MTIYTHTEADEASASVYTNLLLKQGARLGVTEIRMEKVADSLVLRRYRVEEVLHDFVSVHSPLAAPVTTRLKQLTVDGRLQGRTRSGRSFSLKVVDNTQEVQNGQN